MPFESNQRPAAPWSNHGYWGKWSATAALPNTVTATEQFSDLQAGDTAWCTAPGALYLCTDPTPGAAVWVAFGTSATTLVGPANVLYVDQEVGDDLTGTRGNFALPYETIQAALDDMQSYDVVQLAPQTFDIDTPLTIPATVEFGALRGWGASLGSTLTNWWGEGISIIHGVGSTVILDFSTPGLKRFDVCDIDMWNDDVTTVVSADGSAYAVDTYLTDGGLTLTRCGLVGGVSVKYAQYFQLVGCSGGSPCDIVLDTCFLVDVVGTLMQFGTLLVTFDAADPLAPTTQGIVRLRQGTLIGGTGATKFVTLSEQGRLTVDFTSAIGGLRGTDLAVVSGLAPSVTCAGSIGAANGGVVDFYSAAARQIPDSVTPCTFDFRGCRFFGTIGAAGNTEGVGTIGFKVAGAAANPQVVYLGDSEALPAVSLVCGANVRLSAQGADLPGAVITTPDATGYVYPPSPLLLAPVAVAAAPQPVAYPFRFDPAAVNVQVSYQTDNAGSLPTGVITARTDTGFSAGLVAAGGGNLLASVQVP